MDLIDNKILWNLEQNARMPLTRLAQKVNISKQNLNYRLKQLEKGVIRKYVAVINPHKLGYLTYQVYFRTADEEEIVAKLKDCNAVVWFVTLVGSYDIEALFLARNYLELNKILARLNIEKYDLGLSISNLHFKRDYLLNKKRIAAKIPYYGNKIEENKLTEIEIKLLKELQINARQNTVELGNKIGITYHTVKSKLKNLEDRGIITGYRTWLNIHVKYYKIRIKGKIDTRLIELNPNVVYVVNTLTHTEIEMEVDDENQVLSLLSELKKQQNIEYDFLRVRKEHYLDYFPEIMSDN